MLIAVNPCFNPNKTLVDADLLSFVKSTERVGAKVSRMCTFVFVSCVCGSFHSYMLLNPTMEGCVCVCVCACVRVSE